MTSGPPWCNLFGMADRKHHGDTEGSQVKGRVSFSASRARGGLGPGLLAATFLLTLASLPGALLAGEERPPSFIVLLADDLGAAELGCYGNRENRTPNLDRLAAEGMRFETCYAAPICSPTRVTTLTGQYGFRTGYFHFIGREYTPLPSSPDHEVASKLTFADVLKGRGYATALSGKWQLPGKVPTLIHDCGFDEYRMWAYADNLPEGVEHTGAFEGAGRGLPSRYWHPCILENGKYLTTRPEDYGPDLFTDFVLDFARRNRDRPFCAYFTSPLTHRPHLETPDPERPGSRRPAGFASNLEYLDHLVGRLVRGIDGLGLGERTIIFFIGDNGTAGRGKGTVTELGARVPFIVRCPGTVRPGVVSRELTDISDILPTLADLAGARIPEGHPIDGKSLAPILRGASAEHRPWIFSFLGTGRILRDKRWLLELPGDGTERFFDCGESRDGTGYRDVTGSADPQAVAARQKFAEILKGLPGPEARPGLRQPTAAAEAKAAKKAARKASRKSKQAPGP